MMYTSGTTGEPKGVKIGYDNFTAFLEGSLEVIDVGEGDRWANHSSLSFDLSLFDLFGSLISRATLVPVVDESSRLFPGRFIERNSVTVWHSTPTTVRYLLAERSGEALRLQSLKRVLMCGEPVRTEWVKYLLAHCSSDVSVFNCYGPTETTVFCTVDEFSDIDDQRLGGIHAPMGTAIRGVDIAYEVIDAAEMEIVIGGATVGSYDHIAESPQGVGFGEEGGRRYFHTGDTVEIVSGEVFFRGRRDRQVKLRGNRFELAEAEELLKREGCSDCVAAIQDDSLFLFVGPACGCGDDELRNICVTHLPDYAQPRRIMRLSSWPISLNGKLDLKALGEMIDVGD